MAFLTQQSRNIFNTISQGVAGDQGVMYGCACDDTPEMLPTAVVLAHRLAREIPLIGGPDGKAQVTWRGNAPATAILSVQGKPWLKPQIVAALMKHLPPPCKYFPDTFEIGGPEADAGVTGRKLAVDSYGGFCEYGGGAFSGKDPTKVDRSAAYMARYVARQIVKSGISKTATVAVAYAFGVSEPVALSVNLSPSAPPGALSMASETLHHYNWNPEAIIEFLDLRRPIYRATSCYGHFGRKEFPWEA